MSNTNDAIRSSLDEIATSLPPLGGGPTNTANDEAGSSRAGNTMDSEGGPPGITPVGTSDINVTAGDGLGGLHLADAPSNPNYTMEGLVAMIAAINQSIANLEARMTQQSAGQSNNVSAGARPEGTGIGVPVQAMLPMKKRLGELTKFDGTKSHYPSWKLEAMSKLEYDGHLIGDDKARLAYLFMRMEPAAQVKVRAYYNAVQVQEAYTPKLFIEYLDQIWLDPNEASRALQRLQRMRQGNRESFANFFVQFESELAEAAMATESDRTKISYLENAINEDMKRAMIGHPRGSYLQFVARLQLCGSQLDGIYQSQRGNVNKLDGPAANTANTDTSRSNTSGGNRSGNGNKNKSNQARDQEENKAKTSAKWVSKEEILRRREGNLCLRCGKDSHSTRDCILGPAQRPANIDAKKAKPSSDDASDASDDEGKALL